MELVQYERTSAQGFTASSIPKGFAYATLGPKSHVDVVEIGGRRLGIGGIVPVSEGAMIKPVRPRRQSAGTEASHLLELALWQCDETPIARPRASEIVRAQTAVTHATDYTKILQLPVAGRVAAVFKMTGAVAKPFQWGIVGVSYGGNPEGAALGRDHKFLLDSGTYTPATLIASLPGSVADVLAMVKLYGGLDSHEHYDELELWHNCTTADTHDYEAEAYDLPW